MGARLRLKASVGGADPALRTSDPNLRKIFRAMQKYGLVVADNGSDMHVTGTFDTRWNNDVLNPAFRLLTASDFDVVQLGWNPPAGPASLSSVEASPNPVVAQVPASVTVAAGTTSRTFMVTTRAAKKPTSATVTASWIGVTRSATLSVKK